MKLPPGMCVLERGWLSANNILFLGHDDINYEGNSMKNSVAHFRCSRTQYIKK